MGARAALQVVQKAIQTSGVGQRTDPELLAAYLDRNDPTAFEALVRRHGSLVLSACRQVLRDEAAAEDAFQATFVALHQKAGAIRRQTSLAGWLFRVARRTALRARRATDRRARHEARAIRRESAGPDLSWREACAALHEELDQLPDTYRSALILCYLDGLSRDDAACRLGWTLNEVRGRLERGRARLRARLEKRGITLSAGLLAALTVQAIPTGLIESAVRGAARPAGSVAALAIGTWGRFRAITALVAFTGLLVGLGTGLERAPAGSQPTVTPSKPPGAAADAAGERYPVAGRVLDPDGKPAADARIWAVVPWTRAREVARTGSDGSFRLPADVASELTESEWLIRLVATHERFGLGLPVRQKGDELTLRLVKDVPIHGRVLDLQGRPVRGVTVTPLLVRAAAGETLDGWLKKLKAADEQANLATDGEMRRKVAPASCLSPVVTDAQGRFTLSGIGRERLIELRVEGPGIAMAEIQVVTRAGPPIRADYDPGNVKLGYRVYHGATFDFAADPTQPFEGVVTDRETGRPIPHAVVHSVFPYRIETTADAAGRYRLVGLPPGEQRLVARPPAGEPYLPLRLTGGLPLSERPVRLDFALNRAVWVEGTVTNARTGKPIAGASLHYSPLEPNTVRLLSGDAEAFGEAGRTDARGRFKIVAAPGSGAIGVNGPGGPYIAATRRPLQGDSLFWTHEGVRTRWTQVYFVSFDALAVIEFNPTKRPPSYSITLDPGETIQGRVLDPDGKPLAECRASGIREHSGWTSTPLATAEFKVSQVQAGRPRFVLFWHEERKLGGLFRPQTGNGIQEVRLKPTASATGRLVDSGNVPMTDVLVELYFRMPGETGWAPWFPMKSVRTDAKGRFELVNLPEGVEFSVRYTVKKAQMPGRYAREFQVKSGEAINLGDLKPK
jgi:RNA polymerase sigma factor (sigma-70 family)